MGSLVQQKRVHMLVRAAIKAVLVGMFVFSMVQVLNGRWITIKHVRSSIADGYGVKIDRFGKLSGPATNLPPGPP